MTAAIYARKSTDQAVADDQKSVTRQIDNARAFALSKSWAVLDDHVYVDDGISGAEFAKRPGFIRLMNALKPRRRFDVLIMSEESRLGREAIETAYALKQLVSAGVRVFFYFENRERTLETATDKLLMSVTAFADELEREKARQRTYDAMARKARAGHVTGGRVFGYENLEIALEDGRRSHVERRIVDAEAAVVRRIFELTAAGYGQKRVAHLLNEEGAVSPRAQRGRPHAWCPSSIHEALHRELYNGVIVWNRSRKRDVWGRHRQHARPESEVMRIDAPKLRIVPEAVWTEVHERLERRRSVYLDRTGGRAFGRPPAGTVSAYLLTGFVACGCCGGSLVVRTSPHGRQRDPRLACWHYTTRGRTVCANGWPAPMAALEDLVLSAIEDDVLSPGNADAVVARALELLESGETEVVDDGKQVAREIQQIDLELGRLTTLATSGASDIPAVLEALRTRQDRKRLLTARATRSPRTRQPGRPGADVEAALRSRFADWRSLVRRNPVEARPVIESLLGGRIVVTPQQDSSRRAPVFDVRIPLTTHGILEGIFCPKGVASPDGYVAGWTLKFGGIAA